MFGENRRLEYCEPVPLGIYSVGFQNYWQKPVKILRIFLNIVKTEANNWNRYSKTRLIMGMEGY
jgi:hypothetical protein